MIISQMREEGDGCRSLICDSSGIIIAEMVYRCIVCSHVSQSLSEGQIHYQWTHCTSSGDNDMKQEQDTTEFSDEIDAVNRDCDVNSSDREVEFDSRNGYTAADQSSQPQDARSSAGHNPKGGFVTCAVCNMTKFYQSVQRRYGQFTCMGCAKFFGRFLLKPKRYSCPVLGSCSLDVSPRCKACLLYACICTYIIDEKRKAVVDANRPLRRAVVSATASSSQSQSSQQSNAASTSTSTSSQVRRTNASSHLDNRQHVPVKTKSGYGCRNCTGCLAKDCGICNFCRDKPKFGGPNHLKKRCATRRCLDPRSSQVDQPLQPLFVNSAIRKK